MSNTDKNSDLTSDKVKQPLWIDTASGFITGAFCAGLFHPMDRALYLAIAHNRTFLSLANFTSGYQGFSQTIMQRTLLGSIYYIAQGSLKTSFYPYLKNEYQWSENNIQFCIGITAGSISGALSNPVSAIKYHTWGKKGATFFSSAREMKQQGGVKPFIKGTPATIVRDMAFGSTYEVLRSFMRTQLDKSQEKTPGLNFMCNTIAAGFATVVSGPFNHARVKQYATPPNQKPPTLLETIYSVIKESTKYSPLERPGFFQKRFQVGWGTTRVALGMAVGQHVFDTTKEVLTQSPRP